MRTLITFLSVLTLSACAGPDGGSGMSGRLEDMERHIAALRADTETHGARVGAVSDIAALPPEEEVHRGETGQHVGAMNVDMGQMGMCMDGAGQPPDTTGMHDALEDLEDECDFHHAMMGSAGDLTMAGSEEARHQQAMDQMIDGMETMRDQMMGESGDFDCSGGMMGM